MMAYDAENKAVFFSRVLLVACIPKAVVESLLVTFPPLKYIHTRVSTLVDGFSAGGGKTVPL